MIIKDNSYVAVSLETNLTDTLSQSNVTLYKLYTLLQRINFEKELSGCATFQSDCKNSSPKSCKYQPCKSNLFIKTTYFDKLENQNYIKINVPQISIKLNHFEVCFEPLKKSSRVIPETLMQKWFVLAYLFWQPTCLHRT